MITSYLRTGLYHQGFQRHCVGVHVNVFRVYVFVYLSAWTWIICFSFLPRCLCVRMCVGH